MFAPPVDSGGFQFALAVNAPPTAPWVGAAICTSPGRVAGVTVFDAAEMGLVPIPLIAWRRKLYAVPLFSPLISTLLTLPVMLRVPTTVAPLRIVSVYPVMAELLSAPGVHDSDAEELLRVATSAVGAAGVLAAVISLETPNGPAPNSLTPRTSNVYF